jgi:hypothetical protein
MALSAATKKTLSEKAAKARKKGKKVTAGQLGRVYNKGLAAYRTGHRPGTTPSQWAMLIFLVRVRKKKQKRKLQRLLKCQN